jgi:hypothetical protein
LISKCRRRWCNWQPFEMSVCPHGFGEGSILKEANVYSF